MDMFASVMGRANQVVRLDCRSLDFEYFPFETDQYSLVLLDSGVKHQLVDSEYNTRREECEEGVNTLRKLDPKIETLRDVSLDFLMAHKAALADVVFMRCQFVMAEIARVEAACAALQSNDFQEVGRLMFASHDGLNVQYEVCVPETNFLVEQARGHILGARQMGGGFGGCTINLLKNAEIDLFLDRLSTAYRQSFGLDLTAYPVKLMDGVEKCVVDNKHSKSPLPAVHSRS